MKRPYISISGTLDELILMEAILSYYYDVPDEKWNNDAMEFKVSPVTHLVCNPATSLSYHNHPGFGVNKTFKASQIHKILTYIEEYEKN